MIQEARNAGCRTSSEADRYLEHKRKREAEENARRAKESGEVGPSGQGGPNLSSTSEMDILGVYGSDLLSEAVSIHYQLPSSSTSKYKVTILVVSCVSKVCQSSVNAGS